MLGHLVLLLNHTNLSPRLKPVHHVFGDRQLQELHDAIFWSLSLREHLLRKLFPINHNFLLFTQAILRSNVRDGLNEALTIGFGPDDLLLGVEFFIIMFFLCSIERCLLILGELLGQHTCQVSFFEIAIFQDFGIVFERIASLTEDVGLT